MALLHFDGFDLDDWAQRYALTGATFAGSTVTRLGAGRSLACGGSSYLNIPVAAPASVYVGFAHSRTTSSTATYIVQLNGDSGAAVHLQVKWFNTSTIQLLRNGTAIANATVTEPIGSWLYFEMWATIADAGGRCVVKIDGATVIDFTGDTRNSGTVAAVDRVLVGQIGSSGTTYYIDDLYVCDGTGSAPHNTFLGPVRVYTQSPSGAGTDTAMTPLSGANHTNVDEQPYSAADYVTGSTGQRDTYAITDLPASPGTILAAQPVVVAKKTDAGALSLKTSIRSGGTVYSGTTTALSASDSTIRDIRTTDPATSSAWTASGVNAMEAGAEVV